jgi:hypothetical protein
MLLPGRCALKQFSGCLRRDKLNFGPTGPFPRLTGLNC